MWEEAKLARCTTYDSYCIHASSPPPSRGQVIRLDVPFLRARHVRETFSSVTLAKPVLTPGSKSRSAVAAQCFPFKCRFSSACGFPCTLGPKLHKVTLAWIWVCVCVFGTYFACSAGHPRFITQCKNFVFGHLYEGI